MYASGKRREPLSAMELPGTVRISAATRELIASREAVQDTAAGHQVGSRCEVAPGGRRGTVRWVGRPAGLQLCVAVELDVAQGDDVQLGSRFLDGAMAFRKRKRVKRPMPQTGGCVDLNS